MSPLRACRNSKIANASIHVSICKANIALESYSSRVSQLRSASENFFLSCLFRFFNYQHETANRTFYKKSSFHFIGVSTKSFRDIFNCHSTLNAETKEMESVVRAESGSQYSLVAAETNVGKSVSSIV